jgi:galactokinase
MADPPFRAWGPGRVNLIGEHTDYSGGLVLPVAIQLGVEVDVRSRSSAIVLTSLLEGAAEPLDADGGGVPASGWARYPQAVASELAALGRRPVGFTGVVRSDLLAGAGLSSSAALEVAVAQALCAVADFELEPFELALACQRAEFRAVGVPCGILDQAASVLGRDGFALLLDCATLSYELVPVPLSASLLVIDSGVVRSLEATAYARRRQELEHALQLLAVDRSTAVADEDLARLDGVSRRRLRHVVRENERVRMFAEVLRGGDLVRAGQLLAESHASLRDDYEVSVPELDLLVELSCEAGAYGARLLGAGFGGAVLVLADSGNADAIGRHVADAYRAHVGRETRALSVRPSAGAGIRVA